MKDFTQYLGSRVIVESLEEKPVGFVIAVDTGEILEQCNILVAVAKNDIPEFVEECDYLSLLGDLGSQVEDAVEIKFLYDSEMETFEDDNMLFLWVSPIQITVEKNLEEVTEDVLRRVISGLLEELTDGL